MPAGRLASIDGIGENPNMTRSHSATLPGLVVGLSIAALALHGPIPQLANYHAFADTTTWLGVPHAGDVLSNAAFLAVALWAMATERGRRAATPVERRARSVFYASLLL